MGSLQFRSLNTAIAAFENTESEAWAINDGKRLIYKGIGTEDLRAFLELLKDQGTNGTYTLRYFEGIDDKSKIKSNTADDGSFTFKCDADAGDNRDRGFNEYRNERISRMGAMEEKMDRIMERLDAEDSEEATEKPPTSLGVIGDILGHPAIAPLVPNILTMIMGAITGNNQQQAPAMRPLIATVGNVQQPYVQQPETVRKDPPPDKLANAIERLAARDANLADHLDKLAAIAERDPASFQMILSTLDGYPLPQ